MKSFLSVREALMIQRPLSSENAVKDHFLAAIHTHAGTRDLSAEDIHVRGMYLCNSKRDHYYSRFSLSALDEIAELIPGRPVMTGHNYHTLPVGRFFNARRVYRPELGEPKNDSYWLEAHFYVPRDAEGDALVRRIDQGIYREVSIGWRCVEGACALCGNSITDRDRCGHVPGEVYEDGICEYEFNGITAVLEGSLVFAGGQKDTSLFNPDAVAEAASMSAEQFAQRADLDASKLPTMKRAFVSQVPEISSGANMRQLRDSIQSIVMHKERFRDRTAAARWVREHEFRADKATESDDSFRFVQFPDGNCEDGSCRTLGAGKHDNGVQFVVCKKAARLAHVDDSDMTIEALLGEK
jgi:hypothetical protein